MPTGPIRAGCFDETNIAFRATRSKRTGRTRVAFHAGDALRAGGTVTDEHDVEHGLMAARRVLLGIERSNEAAHAEGELRDEREAVVGERAVCPIADKLGHIEGDPMALCW